MQQKKKGTIYIEFLLFIRFMLRMKSNSEVNESEKKVFKRQN